MLIGGEGHVGEGGTALHNHPPVLPRLYPFDPDLLAAEGPNVLAVRVARSPYIDDGPLIEGPLALVDDTAASPAHAQRVLIFTSTDYLSLGVGSQLSVGLSPGHELVAAGVQLGSPRRYQS